MKSRVTGDCQARFREKGGVKLPSTYSTEILWHAGNKIFL